MFEGQGKRFRYVDNEPAVIERVDDSGNGLEALPGRNATGPCCPGGRRADVYAFDSGDRVCLFWP